VTRSHEVLRNGLYLEPCTFCPLDCALCYTAHRQQHLLPLDVAHRAVDLMLEGQQSLGIFWCGLGELLCDPRFFGLLADLDARWPSRLLHSVQTNGQHGSAVLPAPANKVLLLSLDLPRAFTRQHRGGGYWTRAVAFAARHLAAGGIGVGIKCLLTAHTLPSVARSFGALQARLAALSGLPPSQVRRTSWLEPILPFPAEQVARIHSAAFAPRGGQENRGELLALVARHLPEHREALADRPRSLQLAVTSAGLFTCCEAVVKLGEHRELWRLDRSALLDRLSSKAADCETCPLAENC